MILLRIWKKLWDKQLDRVRTERAPVRVVAGFKLQIKFEHKRDVCAILDTFRIPVSVFRIGNGRYLKKSVRILLELHNTGLLTKKPVLLRWIHFTPRAPVQGL